MPSQISSFYFMRGQYRYNAMSKSAKLTKKTCHIAHYFHFILDGIEHSLHKLFWITKTAQLTDALTKTQAHHKINPMVQVLMYSLPAFLVAHSLHGDTKPAIPAPVQALLSTSTIPTGLKEGYWNMTFGVQSNCSSTTYLNVLNTSCDTLCDLMPHHNSHSMIPQDQSSSQDQDLSKNLQGGTNQLDLTPMTPLTHKHHSQT